MGIAEQFDAALAGIDDPDVTGPEFLAVRLAMACTVVLPVDGAGISVFADPVRVPVGASDDAAAVAERLQFTVGQGPCLDAHATGLPVQVGEADLAGNWPVYYDRLVTRTPFRGVSAFPLAAELARTGSLDLFFRHPEPKGIGTADVDAVRGRITTELVNEELVSGGGQAPSWLDSPAATARQQVLIAIGMASVALDLPTGDALAALRAYAYGHDTTLDELAADLVTGRLHAQALQPDGNG
jgi:hypothetical protein